MDTESNLELLDYLSRMEVRLLAQIEVLGTKIIDLRSLLITMSEEVTLLQSKLDSISSTTKEV